MANPAYAMGPKGRGGALVRFLVRRWRVVAGGSADNYRDSTNLRNVILFPRHMTAVPNDSRLLAPGTLRLLAEDTYLAKLEGKHKKDRRDHEGRLL